MRSRGDDQFELEWIGIHDEAQTVCRDEHTEDCYLLVDDATWNAKIRDNTPWLSTRCSTAVCDPGESAIELGRRVELVSPNGVECSCVRLIP